MPGPTDRADAPPEDPVACAECGSASPERQYVRILERPTCEHCLLDARKRAGGLADDPYEQFVESLAEALDLRERETGLHSKRVATHTLLLAAHHYTDVKDLREVYWGSLLHDIGKIGVPDAVLLKPGRLTDEEWRIMREHPANGHLILEKLPFLAMAADIVLCHEECYDGSGYPAGLKGEQIPLAARLFAVIDTLDAMTFDRPYRKALPFDTAKAEIQRMAGSQFDPLAVATFLAEEAALREMVAMEFPPTR
ncbi:MAG TPA: HD-GYP domain-containing protein [Rhodocyclaceae bacterium]|nr:HD-GYP domain-containing protein [Rhodocyclaceae bacterium]